MSDWEDPYYRLPRKNPNLQRVWKARAHAKVNIHLGVGPAREDGYHELSTVFQSVDIYDDITLTIRDEVIERGYSPVVGPLKITGPTAAGVPTDESNLVWKAIDRLAVHVPLTYPRLDVEIHKRIPAAGGMAGGSADAAAALMLAQKLYATYFELDIASDEILHDIAADLGSDVPFTMMGGTALGKGRGEVLSPMLTRGTYHWCFIASHQGLSTPDVFRKLDDMREASGSDASRVKEVPRGKDASTSLLEPSLDVTDVAQALVSGDVHRLAKVLKNNLQPAALSLRPDLRKTLEVGKDAGALAGIVSGSGPTIAFLCEDAAQAEEVRTQVTLELPKTRGYVTSSPAPGVRLL
ncbi:4-(cytidine 5'-diphospho)-2-C-methyl-D-erythritol kinase [Corynebacterium sp.]|uniref:4-(cytidine 5'-diphospho)-2-C-methyl-D-erythritol kinase n=1 Tax=Corynebacterium sp. TaxID=1720 RepID=UPI0028AFD349|nr:4-(cytidine 5'-diphospho)-2-C-methyl-D-erythritol kinase [Corynebacterium sp.]